MTNVNKGMNPLHFGSDPANTRFGSFRKCGFKFQIHFVGWGDQSSRRQVHLALPEVCFVWIQP